MSQQINLFNPLFRKQRFSFTSATTLLYGIGIACVLAAVAVLYTDYDLRDVQNRARVLEISHTEATARRDKLMAQLNNQKPDAQLAAEIAGLDVRLQGLQDVVGSLNNGAIGNTDGFSSYMRAFARQSINGLWLTGFDIAQAGSDLAIQGRTLNPDLVAIYLRQLNQESALQGRKFAALNISQPPPEPKPALAAESSDKAEKSAAAKDAKEQKPSAPRYLEFTISTREIPERAQIKPSSASEAPLLGAIDSAPVLNAARSGATQEAR